ncbi:MAG: hypothetical protein QF473_12745 [Planctomycetota bacterium]|jgi:hypothetical protein|nr:hypothetical protein [Planctomycetota bacterium]
MNTPRHLKKELTGSIMAVIFSCVFVTGSPARAADLSVEVVPVNSLAKLPPGWLSKGVWAVKPYLSFNAAKDAALKRGVFGDGFILAGFQPLSDKSNTSKGLELDFPGGSMRLETFQEGEGSFVSLTLTHKGKQLGQKKSPGPAGRVVLMLERKGNTFSGWYCKPGEKFTRLASLDWADVGPVVQAGIFGEMDTHLEATIRVAALKVGGARPDPKKIVELFDETGVFIGTVQGDRADLVYANGDAYKGGYKSDKKHGKGAFTWFDGASYVGGYRNDLMHGKGVHTEPDGTKYAGDYKDGKMHGKGTFTWPDGSQYVGEWKDNKRHGKGVFTWPAGDRYEGEYKDDSESGGWFFSADGKLTWARVDEKGEWVFGK